MNPLIEMEAKMAVPVQFAALAAGQKFILAPIDAYAPISPAFVFMKLAPEGDSRYTAVNLTTGVQTTMTPTGHVVPVAG